MDCAVIYSEVALADLEQITAFIAPDNSEVAERFANRLVDLAESLRSLPERGRPVKKWPGVRVLVLAPYLIFITSKRRPTQLKYCVFGIGRKVHAVWSYKRVR